MKNNNQDTTQNCNNLNNNNISGRQDKYYVTSPIYYVNDKPHIGHAYTTIVCDIIARIQRLSGTEVLFMTGTDEHGQKIQRSAENARIQTSIFVDNMAKNFHDLADILQASYDIFLRTSNQSHKDSVIEIWNKLIASGDIYLDKYCGWYSVRDEAFYDEDELDNAKLAPSGSPVEWVEEECYFFALSKWEKPLLEFYHNHSNFVIPQYRFNEVISFVKTGLKDLAVSRTAIQWGVPVPGNDRHVIYVWLDALSSYLSALRNNTKIGQNQWEHFWPASAHVVGKDILRFHAVYWPAFLMALGLALPKHIVSHGWWLNEGQKISKSLGNVIDPIALINEFGLDNIRYFLIREISFGSDGNFTRANLISRINTELNNKIGNLCQRVLSFIYKQLDGKLDNVNADEIYQDELTLESAKLPSLISSHMQTFSLHLILDHIIDLADLANKYVDINAPWQLIKHNPAKANLSLLVLLESIRYLGICLQPFIPNSAGKILDQLQISEQERTFQHLKVDFAINNFIMSQPSTPIFTKVE